MGERDMNGLMRLCSSFSSLPRDGGEGYEWAHEAVLLIQFPPPDGERDMNGLMRLCSSFESLSPNGGEGRSSSRDARLERRGEG
jgi:hypothetical protein